MHPMIAERLFARAFEDHRAGRLVEAEAGYRALLTATPRHAPARHLLGLIRFQDKDNVAAAALIGEALVIAPEQAVFHLSLGMVEEAVERVGAAEAAYRRAILLRPDFDQAFYSLGAILSRQRRPVEAVTQLRRALLVTPDHPVASAALATTLLTLGNAAAAEAIVRSVLRHDRGRTDAWAILGKVLHRQGRLDEALSAFDQALTLDPGHIDARIDRTATLEALDDPVGALDALEAAATTDQGEALFTIGSRLFEAGRDDPAVAIYRRFAGLTSRRDHYPGHPPQIVTVRPAGEVCRERGWPYHTLAAARPFRVAADDGDGAEGNGGIYAYDLPEVFLARAENVVILPGLHAPLIVPPPLASSHEEGATGDGVLLIDGFNTNSRVSLPLLPHIVWHAGNERMLLDLPPPTTWIEEEAILLGGGPNWSHGVLDWLSKLVVLERHRELERLPVLVAADLPRSILDLAEQLGLARERMRSVLPAAAGAMKSATGGRGVVAARRLWLPSLTHHYKFTSPLHLDFLRRRLAGPLGEGRGGRRRRLFLSRRAAGYRTLVNEAEVLAALAPFGVEVVVPEELTMIEQLRLFAAAELIVGPLGGGSAACVFAAPDAACVELTHDKMIMSQYAILAGLQGQRFRRVVGTLGASRGRLSFDYDFTVSPAAVAATVRQLLGGQRLGGQPSPSTA